jgi:hypothetical protein
LGELPDPGSAFVDVAEDRRSGGAARLVAGARDSLALLPGHPGMGIVEEALEEGWLA